MATIQGTGGAVTLPSNFTAKISSWSASINQSVVDTSGFTDNGYRTKATTKLTMTGSASGTGDDTTTPAAATLLASTAALASAKGTLTLTAASGCTYTGTAIIRNVQMTRPHDGKFDVSFDFAFTGEITDAWDETA